MTTGTCGCGGGGPRAPLPVGNPPGLDVLRRRVGTHNSFLATLEAGLAKFSALDPLKTRDPADPAVAVLDAWATIADVITFYQERFANEAYLRTATERRSVAELARLVGYKLREGVAAGVNLAFTLEATDPTARAVVPAGTPAQSLPKPGELPQTFETSAALNARAEWNLLPVRRTRPQRLAPGDLKQEKAIYFKGIATNVKVGDPLLVTFLKADGQVDGEPYFVRATAVEPDPVADRTKVTVRAPGAARQDGRRRDEPRTPLSGGELLLSLVARRAEGATNALRQRTAPDANLRDVLTNDKELLNRLVTVTRPDLRGTFQQVLRNQQAAPAQVQVSALRLTAPLYGHNAQRIAAVKNNEPDVKYWRLARADADTRAVWLDVEAPQVLPKTWIVIDGPRGVKAFIADQIVIQSRDDYNLPGKKTRIALADTWADDVPPDQIQDGTNFFANQEVTAFSRLRQTTVYAAPEELALADEPIPETELIGGRRENDGQIVFGDLLELQSYVPDLDSGRPLIVSGERADLPGVTGVTATELVRIKLVQHVEPDQAIDLATGAKRTDPKAAAGWRYTVLQFQTPFTYVYRRSTVKVYGNVVPATHGETRTEVLGGGDGSRPWLSFTLRQFPVTRLPAPTPGGSQSTLEVRVDQVRWHEVDRLREAGPADHVYSTTTDEAGRTTVTFGDGRYGARTPTGVENVRARLRVGMGTAGNVQAGQILLLPQPPPGVQAVTNPLDAAGGADPEGVDRARRNAPLGTLTLGRVVSVRDYAAFARTFAGIGKAESVLLTADHRRFIQVTVAGADDSPLPPDSDLMVNLARALERSGRARLPFRIDPRERVFAFLGAGIRMDPDYLWQDVHPRLRRALVGAFPFENRGLGRDLFLSEVLAALQAVAGVLDVEVDYFFGVEERRTDPQPTGPVRVLKTPQEMKAEIDAILAPQDGETPDQAAARRVRRSVTARPAGVDGGAVRPAQIAYFGPETLDELKATVSFRLISP